MAVDKSKVLKWSLIAIGAIVIGVIFYAIFAKKSTTTHTGGGGTTVGGIGTTIAGLLTGASGWLNGVFGSNTSTGGGNTGGTKYCDCDRPGYTIGGDQDNNCKPGGLFYDSEC